jgi:hypothetical protein
MQDSRFNPDWRDDVLDLKVLDYPLIFPENSSPQPEGIWVKSQPELEEMVFGKVHRLEKPRWVTAIVKKSDFTKVYALRNEKGELLPPESSCYDIIFPPQAWMTDSLQERCMMLAAAQQARGKVLVGGLGLAVYPQLLFQLQRPIETITIVEQNPVMIKLLYGTNRCWIDPLSSQQRQQIRMVIDPVEKYLQETSESFDTIFFDVWEESDPRFLPSMNYLIQLALPHCTPTGQVYCWGYAMMVDTFVQNAKMFFHKNIPLQDYHLDPALDRYSKWLQEHNNGTLTDEAIETVARDIALTTVKPITEYDRIHCFTPYARSHTEAYRNMALARKQLPSPEEEKVG